MGHKGRGPIKNKAEIVGLGPHKPTKPPRLGSRPQAVFLPVFNVLQILLALIISLVFGIGMGVYPAKKAGDIAITDALRDI